MYTRTHHRITTRTKPDLELAAAERKAWEMYPGDRRNSVLVGWYDHQQRTGAPMEAAGDEPFKAALDYAKSRGMTSEVRINDAGYSFFYCNKPADTAELDPEMVVEVHRDIDPTSFSNLQGG